MNYLPGLILTTRMMPRITANTRIIIMLVLKGGGIRLFITIAPKFYNKLFIFIGLTHLGFDLKMFNAGFGLFTIYCYPKKINVV